MGFFAKKKKQSDPENPDYGATYNLSDDDDLPVATMVTDMPPATAPMQQQPSFQQPTPPPPQHAKPVNQQQQAQIATMSTVFLTRAPTLMQPCPCCQAHARTRVVTFPNWVTWSLCAIIFLICWPLCWLPVVLTKVKIQTSNLNLPSLF
ncbi:expressed unknown protein [Seminavis robusta]|uniref:LITAF domain-containing protein n=1 Tax=Seminavis robusta TaxID=568900 RepID=A0A9N8EDI6_9STRA|nr:expressed unknown protein [Seminavis robusta]|eukprot:Sro1018_g231900.1 n/a (149) ;mRNA; r:34610-35056